MPHGRALRPKWSSLFVLRCDAVTYDAQKCAGLVELLELLAKSIDESDSSSWLHGYHPLEAYTHADLNLANILVDVRGTLWLIDVRMSNWALRRARPFICTSCLHP